MINESAMKGTNVTTTVPSFALSQKRTHKLHWKGFTANTMGKTDKGYEKWKAAKFREETHIIPIDLYWG